MPITAGADNDRTKSRFCDLAMQFESLGGGGHGCEFGLFQRELGAEPLSLLRWADLGPDQLACALETRLAGIGYPHYTTIFAANEENNSEWWTTDTRYHMAMRTFIKTSTMTYDEVSDLVLKRLRFLSNKLIDDLIAGSKIFVYRHMYRNLLNSEIRRLHEAVRSYGHGYFLYLRYEDEQHQNGAIEILDDSLLIGYVDHFAWSSDDQYIGPATNALVKICQEAIQVIGR